MGDFGSPSANATTAGTLYAAMRSRHHSRMSSAAGRAPARATITALTVSPRRGSGVAMTQTSWTSGWAYIIASTSAGQTLKPEALIMRFSRSTRKK